MSKGVQLAPSLGLDSIGKSELTLPSVQTQFHRVLPSATFFLGPGSAPTCGGTDTDFPPEI